jgi:hypothetical protein
MAYPSVGPGTDYTYFLFNPSMNCSTSSRRNRTDRPMLTDGSRPLRMSLLIVGKLIRNFSTRSAFVISNSVVASILPPALFEQQKSRPPSVSAHAAGS